MKSKIELKGNGAPECTESNGIVALRYASAEDYAARASADDLAIRKAVKVIAAEIPPTPGPTVCVRYTIAG